MRPKTHAEINEYRRNAIITGTITCIARLGLEGTTVRTVAAEADTSRGLLGHYFASRDELIVQAHKHLCDFVADKVKKNIEKTNASACAQLESMAATIFSTSVFSERNARAFLGFWHAATIYPQIRRNHETLYSGYRDDATVLFEAAAREQGISIDARMAAFTLIALIDGLWLELSLEKKRARTDAIGACVQFISLQTRGHEQS